MPTTPGGPARHPRCRQVRWTALLTAVAPLIFGATRDLATLGLVVLTLSAALWLTRVREDLAIHARTAACADAIVWGAALATLSGFAAEPSGTATITTLKAALLWFLLLVAHRRIHRLHRRPPKETY